MLARKRGVSDEASLFDLRVGGYQYHRQIVVFLISLSLSYFPLPIGFVSRKSNNIHRVCPTLLALTCKPITRT